MLLIRSNCGHQCLNELFGFRQDSSAVWLKRQFVRRFEVADSSQRQVKYTGTVEVLPTRACGHRELLGRLSHGAWFEADRESYSP